MARFANLLLPAAVASALFATAAPAAAQVVAYVVSNDGARIVLHDRSGPCVGAARLAEHIAAGGEKVPGCWLMTTEGVLVSFLDGERGDIPLKHLQKPLNL